MNCGSNPTIQAVCSLLLALIGHVVHTFDYHIDPKEMDLVTAASTCHTLGEKWNLPVSYSTHKDLARILQEHKLKAAWLGIRKHIFINWHWTNGHIYSFEAGRNKSGGCAALNVTYPYQIVAVDCEKENINYICEYEKRDNQKCPNLHMCFKINKTSVAVGCKAGNWYLAKEFCQRLGGNLIVLESEDKLYAILSRLSSKTCPVSQRLFHIGLHKEDWMPISDFNNSTEENMPSRAKACAIVTINQRGDLTRVSRNCRHFASAVCEKDDMMRPTPLSTYAGTTEMKHSDPAISISIPVIVAISIGCIVLVALACVLTFVYFNPKERRNKRSRTAGSSQEMKDLNLHEESQRLLAENQKRVSEVSKSTKSQVSTHSLHGSTVYDIQQEALADHQHQQGNKKEHETPIKDVQQSVKVENNNPKQLSNTKETERLKHEILQRSNGKNDKPKNVVQERNTEWKERAEHEIQGSSRSISNQEKHDKREIDKEEKKRPKQEVEQNSKQETNRLGDDVQDSFYKVEKEISKHEAHHQSSKDETGGLEHNIQQGDEEEEQRLKDEAQTSSKQQTDKPSDDVDLSVREEEARPKKQVQQGSIQGNERPKDDGYQIYKEENARTKHDIEQDIKTKGLKNNVQQAKKEENDRPKYEVFLDQHLCKERLENIRKEKRNLTEKMDLMNLIMTEELVSHKVIQKHQCENIEKVIINEDKVSCLLDTMEKMTNRQYADLCKILDKHGQGSVVQNFLLTEVDEFYLQEKLARWFVAEFTDIRLYNIDKDDQPTPIDDIYVNMTWCEITKDLIVHKTIKYNSYVDLFQKVLSTDDTHAIVTGVPGAGKTTFVKRLCYEWACHILYKERDSVEGYHNFLYKYAVIIPLILRLIQKDSPLCDVVKDQLPNLSTIEFYTLYSLLKRKSQRVLLLLDGYDELSCLPEELKLLLQKQQYHPMPVVVTSRPHSLTVIRQLGGQAVDQLVQITGFNEEQARKYVRKYFRNNKDKAERMIDYLNKRSDLKKMTFVPIQLEMMCFVWNHKEDLGNSLAELYERFVMCLLDHMEKRKKIEKRTPEAKIIQQYMKLLLAVGKLANQWSKSFRLQATFDYETLQQTTKEYTEEVIALGCVTKYHPSSTKESSYWAFTHLTIQEYFVAFFLYNSSSQAVLTDIEQKCYNVNILQRLKVVFKFLIGITPATANTILGNIIRKYNSEEDCKKLLELLIELMPEYNSAQFKLPLPQHVDTEVFTDSSQKYMSLMFDKDKDFKNLANLKTENLSNPNINTCLVYIKKLHFVPKTLAMVTAATESIKICSDIKSLTCDFTELKGHAYKADHKQFKKCVQTFVLNISTKSLESITMTGKDIMEAASAYLQQGAQISDFKLIDRHSEFSEKQIDSLCKNITGCKSISLFHLEVKKLSVALVNLKQGVNVSLKIASVTPEDLSHFLQKVEIKPERPGIVDINLRGNLTGCGKDLGKLLKDLDRLEALALDRCDITPDTLAGLTKDMKKVEEKVKLKLLSLCSNKLRGGGQQLASLLHHTQQLQTLDVCDCDLRDGDVAHLASALKFLKLLQNLRLRNSEIGESAAAALGELWPHLPDLQVLDVSWCKMRPAAVPLMLDSPQQPRLHKLRVLNLLGNNLSNDGLRQLTICLPSLPGLQALSVTDCYCEDVDTLLHLTTSLPPSLTHLGVSDNCGAAVVQMTQQKERLAQLDRLNIGDYRDTNLEETVEAIRQELLVLNPDIHVYRANIEEMWTMYFGANKE